MREEIKTNGLKGVKIATVVNGRDVCLKVNGKWIVDRDFRPYFYYFNTSYQREAIEEIKRCLQNGESAKDVPVAKLLYMGYVEKLEIVKRRVFWDLDAEPLDLVKLVCSMPGDVPKMAKFLLNNDDCAVFSTDVPYLTNYLVSKRVYLYNAVDKLRTIVFDVETVENKPVLIVAKVGDFWLTDFKFQEHETLYFQDDPIDNVRRFLKSLKKHRVDMAVGHNVSYDWSMIVNLASKHYRGTNLIPTMKTEQVYSGVFHGDVVKIPKFLINFDTMYALKIALQRPRSYNLKLVCNYLNPGRSRENIPGHLIAETWKSDKERVVRYCLDDVRDTVFLLEYEAPNIFIPCKIAGIPIESMIFHGVKTIWETLLMRWCVDHDVVIPHFSKKQFEREELYSARSKMSLPEDLDIRGAYVKDVDEKFKMKVLNNVIHVDFTAFFPNILLRYNISPETVFRWKPPGEMQEYDSHEIELKSGEKIKVFVRTDKIGSVLTILKGIYDTSLKLKQDSKRNPRLKPLYQGYKSIRNSCWAAFGTHKGDSRFKNLLCLALTHQKAREIMEELERQLGKRGMITFSVDTDGLYCIPVDESLDVQAILAEIQARIHEKFGQEFDIDFEVYDKMFFFDSKNYVAFRNGRMEFKGFLTSREIPEIERRGIVRHFEVLFDSGNRKDLIQAMYDTLREIDNSDNPEDFAFTVTIKKEYSDKTRQLMLERLGSGARMVYVSKPANKTPKPMSYYELMERFKFHKLDREWYKWHFRQYLLSQRIGFSPVMLSDFW